MPTHPKVAEIPFETGVYGDGVHGDDHVTLRACDEADTVLRRREMAAPRFRPAALAEMARRDADEPDIDADPGAVAEDAIQYLNESTDGGHWSFHEGDLRLDAALTESDFIDLARTMAPIPGGLVELASNVLADIYGPGPALEEVEVRFYFAGGPDDECSLAAVRWEAPEWEPRFEHHCAERDLPGDLNPADLHDEGVGLEWRFPDGVAASTSYLGDL
jgi:hypothetical protein